MPTIRTIYLARKCTQTSYATFTVYPSNNKIILFYIILYHALNKGMQMVRTMLQND